jgi:hypothetical protein
MKKLLILVFLLPLVIFGQSICGTDEYNAKIQHRGPLYHLRNDSVDLTTQYTIPVVVHLLENDSSKAPVILQDADIAYIINCLNRDFNLQNADTSILTDTLKALPGDMRITFKLADIDPNGNATNGITRTKTTVEEFTHYNNGIKFDSLGGINAWNTKKYLNIWAGVMWPGLLGYSQFPGGDTLTDGIVVQSDIMRLNPSTYPTYMLGNQYKSIEWI